jgi:hypothetical protein
MQIGCACCYLSMSRRAAGRLLYISMRHHPSRGWHWGGARAKGGMSGTPRGSLRLPLPTPSYPATAVPCLTSSAHVGQLQRPDPLRGGQASG